MSLFRLEDFGWSSFYSGAFQSYAAEGHTAGRVCRAARGLFRVLTEEGEIDAELSGRFLHSAGSGEWPAAGDWVVLRGGQGIIETVLPRKTKFSRKRAGTRTEEQILAANIDVVFLVSGLDRDLNFRRIERYLLLARESGAAPVVLLNKADLCEDPAATAEEVRSVTSGAPVVLTSAVDAAGLDELGSYAGRGQTAALFGSSGAGKSTIVNRLLGFESQSTRPVREWDGRGRHTTSAAELILLPSGWLLLDTPGLRELQLWADQDGLDQVFNDVSELASGCRFRDCRHQGEPGCAVAEAIEEGALDEGRLENFQKLRGELDHLERKRDQRAAAEEKRNVKRIHRMMRKMPHRF